MVVVCLSIALLASVQDNNRIGKIYWAAHRLNGSAGSLPDTPWVDVGKRTQLYQVCNEGWCYSCNQMVGTGTYLVVYQGKQTHIACVYYEEFEQGPRYAIPWRGTELIHESKRKSSRLKHLWTIVLPPGT